MRRFKKNKLIFFGLGLVALGFFLFKSELSISSIFEAQVYDARQVVKEELANANVFVEEKVEHLTTPEPTRAIYMTSWVASTPSWRADLVKFSEDSEINAIVIDVKDYSGRIAFEVFDPMLREFGAEEIRVRDFKEFIKGLHEKNIYAIARISVFQDPYLAARRPDLAVKNSSGGIWKDRKGIGWVDPAARWYWDYIIKLARETERLGFDELNFDYVRFPSDGNMKDIVYNHWDAKIEQKDVLLEFFAYLDTELENLGIPISVDLFGLVTTVENHDLKIGQILEYAVPYFDYIAPMVYPSHYPSGFIGLANPVEHPYEVIYYAMSKAYERLIRATSTPSKLRPWLQDFDLGATYDAGMILKQKQAVYDSGLTSWMVWDPTNKYTRSAYYPQ